MTKKIILIAIMGVLTSCSQELSLKTPEALISDGILNGKPAQLLHDFTLSTVALIEYSENFKTSTAFCTGTLISKNLVVTANHCLRDMRKNDMRVVFGTAADTADESLIREVENFRLHDFQAINDLNGLFLTAKNDIAVIKLKSVAPQWARPAVIAEKARIFKNSQILLSGFGVFDDTTMNQKPNLHFTNVRIHELTDDFLITDQTSNTGACAGDSGGPAFTKDPSSQQLVLVGVTRGPHNQARNCHEYGEYTRVDNHKVFINRSAIEMNGFMPVFN